MDFKNHYMHLNPVRINQRVENILNDVLVDIIKFNFQTELLGENNE